MAHKTDHDRQSIDAMKLKLKHASTSTITSDDDDVKIVTNCSLIAIGICDIAGAGCRALKALCSAEDSKCVRREFELEFVTRSDLRAAESDVDDVDDVGDEFDDDFTSLERAVFVSETAFEAVGSTTTKTNSNNGDSNAASLIQFIDTASGDANLSCIVINAVVYSRVNRRKRGRCGSILWGEGDRSMRGDEARCGSGEIVFGVFFR
jgi:hypothetical protein